MFPGLRRCFWKFRILTGGPRLELRVSQVLEELRKFGYRAFDNLRQDGDNIEHVIVGPAGVFAIATKRLIDHGENEFRSSENYLQANGEGLFLRGFPEEDCLKQAGANVFEINRIIKETCEFDGWVWPLVVFAGKWAVRSDETTNARLFTTDKLVNHIVNQQPRLSPGEIKEIVSHLERSAKDGR